MGEIMAMGRLDQAARQRLRSKAEHVEGLLERSHDERAAGNERLPARRQRRAEWYGRVEDAALDLVGALPAGTEDYEARQMFVFLTELRRAVDADPQVVDEGGGVALAAIQMADVARRLDRRLEHAALEEPDAAAAYVLTQLDPIGATQLSRLLGVSAKTVGAWRAGRPTKHQVERVKLVAQLVAYLRYSMTPTGLVLWFENPVAVLGGRAPLALLDESVGTAWGPLVAYARGGRG